MFSFRIRVLLFPLRRRITLIQLRNQTCILQRAQFEESGEFVHVGPVLVSAYDSAALFQIAACLGWSWQRYRRHLLWTLTRLLLPYQRLFGPSECFAGGLLLHFLQLYRADVSSRYSTNTFSSDTGPSVSAAIENYEASGQI